jgi:hypothetical protein
LTIKEKITINKKRFKHNTIDFHNNFIDSIMSQDQNVRHAIDTIMDENVIKSLLIKQDESNSMAVITFTKSMDFQLVRMPDGINLQQPYYFT